MVTLAGQRYCFLFGERNFPELAAPHFPARQMLTLDVNILTRYYTYMILSFRCKETEKLARGQYSRKLPADIQRIAARKLKMLNDAVELNDLRVPPANRLEALKGGRKGQYSIRINNQWRLCFRWHKGNASDVQIMDYH